MNISQDDCPYCHHYGEIVKHVNSSRYDDYKNFIEVSPAHLELYRTNEFITSFQVNFCPMCGRRITKELIK